MKLTYLEIILLGSSGVLSSGDRMSSGDRIYNYSKRKFQVIIFLIFLYTVPRIPCPQNSKACPQNSKAKLQKTFWLYTNAWSARQTSFSQIKRLVTHYFAGHRKKHILPVPAGQELYLLWSRHVFHLWIFKANGRWGKTRAGELDKIVTCILLIHIARPGKTSIAPACPPAIHPGSQSTLDVCSRCVPGAVYSSPQNRK